MDEAGKLENKAFQYLFDKNIDQALATCEECEKTYPSYHSVYDLKNMLKKEREGLLDKNSGKWKEIYLKILNNYSWRLSTDIMDKLRLNSK